MPTSSGCKRWVVCGGKVSRWTLFSAANTKISGIIWLPWGSISKPIALLMVFIKSFYKEFKLISENICICQPIFWQFYLCVEQTIVLKAFIVANSFEIRRVETKTHLAHTFNWWSSLSPFTLTCLVNIFCCNWCDSFVWIYNKLESCFINIPNVNL